MQSKCGACNGTSFEMVEANGDNKAIIKNTTKAYNFVQCSGCGAVVGVTEAIHVSSWLWEVMKKLGVPAP
jgi:hypothetical protein